MERKAFLKNCGQLCLGGLVVAGTLNACTSYHYAPSHFSENRLSVLKSEFFEEKKGEIKPRKFVIVRSEKLNFPICIYKLNEHTYSALFMECSHNSCELNPFGDFLICPCHGSEFSNIGKVQNPPAEKDLYTFKISDDETKIYIHLA